MIRALVLTHGRLGEELVKVVELFLGPVEGLAALSNSGLSAERLVDAVGGWLSGEAAATAEVVLGPLPAVILVDDHGGSCATAARLAAVERDDTRVICGVNLAMLLGFVSWRDSLELPDLVRRMVNAARGAIVEIGLDR